MDYAFSYTMVFNADLAALDVSNVQTFEGTFEGARDFNRPLSRWDLRSARSLFKMFKQTASFNQDLSTWNVSRVVMFDSMFNGAKAFNQPLAAWRITSSPATMRYMFQSTSKFNQPLAAWNMSTVEEITGMFQDAKAFNQDLGGWDLRSLRPGGGSSTENQDIFKGACAFNQDLSAWNVPAFLLPNCQDFVQKGWFTFAQLPYVACQQAYGPGSFTTTNSVDRQTYCAALP